MSDLIDKLKNNEGGEGKDFDEDRKEERVVDKLQFKMQKPATLFTECKDPEDHNSQEYLFPRMQ